MSGILEAAAREPADVGDQQQQQRGAVGRRVALGAYGETGRHLNVRCFRLILEGLP